MPTLSANEFLSCLISDDKFRKSLYVFESHDERLAHIAEVGFSFSNQEFEDAVNLRTTEDQSEVDAATLADLSLWWKMLAGTMGEENGGKDCSPSACAGCSSDCST